MYSPELGAVGQENYKETEVTSLKKRTHSTACMAGAGGGGMACGEGLWNTWKAGDQGSLLNIHKP